MSRMSKPLASYHVKRAASRCQCGADLGNNYFDRAVCACGAMHQRCTQCGRADDCKLDSKFCVEHHTGDESCPDCGSRYDPVTGYCSRCEGELRLYRVQAFSPGWLAADSVEPPAAAFTTVASAKHVPARVAELLPGAQLIVIQKQ